MNNPWWWIEWTCCSLHIYIFCPLNHVQCASFYQGLEISIKVPSINLIHPSNSCKCTPFLQVWVIRSHLQMHGWCMMQWIMHHHTMQNLINSHKGVIHNDVMFHMKFKRCCLGVNFHCMFDTTRTSPIMMQNKISDLKALTLTLTSKIYTLFITPPYS
jgi:hypothetical protein